MENKQMGNRPRPADDQSTSKTGKGFINSPDAKEKQASFNPDQHKTKSNAGFDQENRRSDINQGNRSTESSETQGSDGGESRNPYTDEGFRAKKDQKFDPKHPNADPNLESQTQNSHRYRDETQPGSFNERHNPQKPEYAPASNANELERDQLRNQVKRQSGMQDAEQDGIENENIEDPLNERGYTGSQHSPKKKNQAPPSKSR